MRIPHQCWNSLQSSLHAEVDVSAAGGEARRSTCISHWITQERQWWWWVKLIATLIFKALWFQRELSIKMQLSFYSCFSASSHHSWSSRLWEGKHCQNGCFKIALHTSHNQEHHRGSWYCLEEQSQWVSQCQPADSCGSLGPVGQKPHGSLWLYQKRMGS